MPKVRAFFQQILCGGGVGIDMKNYMDRIWAVMENTILTYSGTDAAINIPDRFADMQVHAIGDGAFMDSDKMQQVVVPVSIDSIGSQAFFGNTNLVNVYVPGTVTQFGAEAFGRCPKLINFTCYDVELSERRYNDLISSCVRANGTIYVARSFPEMHIAKNALDSMGIKPAALIPAGVKRLFISQNLSEDIGSASLARNLDRFEFAKTDGNLKELTEEEAFASSIGSEDDAFLDKDTEVKNDAFVRVEKYPYIDKTAVFTFDDSRTKMEDDKRFITANIKIGYFFWQSGVSVKYNGKEYYIYRRHYLSGTFEYVYIRRDTAVFTKKGLVTNKREAQEVYAKYKLLSIL